MKFVGREVALKENGVSSDECSALIRMFCNKSDSVVTNNKDAGKYTNDTQYQHIPLFLNKSPELSAFINSKCNQHITEYCKRLNLSPRELGDEYEPASLMCFRVGRKDKFDTHFDASGYDHYRSVAIIWYLNDVDEGGILQLPSKLQHISIKPKKGTIAIVPAGWTHYHYVEPPISNDRYSLITFLRFKREDTNMENLK